MWNEPGRTDEACLKPPEEGGVRWMIRSWRAPRDRGTQAPHPVGALAALPHGAVDTWPMAALTITALVTWVATVALSTVAVPGPQDGQSLLLYHLLRSLTDLADQASRSERWKSTRSSLASGTMRL